VLVGDCWSAAAITPLRGRRRDVQRVVGAASGVVMTPG